jgi:hypothetical protein
MRTWLNHSEKCNKKLSNPKLSDVLSKKRDIVKARRQEFDKACQSKINASDRVDDGKSGGKRKAEGIGSQPQRRRLGVGNVELNPDTSYGAVTIGMNIP